jgi:hypothetical protein
MKHLDYIDDLIDKELKETKEYPKVLELSEKSIAQIKKELLLESETQGSWIDTFPKTYRGIPIKIIKEK